MKWSFWLAISLFFILYGGINFYVGLRGWQNLFRFVPHASNAVYWALLFFAAAAIFLQRLLGKWLPLPLDTALAWIGSYWLGMLYYFFLLILVVDGICFLAGLFSSYLPGQADRWRLTIGLLVFSVVLVLQVVGTWNAQNTRLRHYQITIPKAAGTISELHVVMVSDIHLDKIVGTRRLQKMVTMVNAQQPDIVLLAGDVIDSSIEVFAQAKIHPILAQLQPKYGVFAVPGNHEYISGKLDDFISQMEQAGIRVLRDERLMISDSFYLVGRDEPANGFGDGHLRHPLSELMAGADLRLPVIILDHQPGNLAEGVQAGADLQLSGHTHRGQLFPGQWLTARIFENDWGYLKKENFQVIVSSGFGTWGPPIRLGSVSEIVDIRISFQE